jgi:transcriptional regulator GlxA family with amidase domain
MAAMTTDPQKLPARAVFLVYPGLQLQDLVGPLEILGAANQLLEARGLPPRYARVLVSPDGAPVAVGPSMTVQPRRAAALRGAIADLWVPGRFDVDAMLAIPGLVDGVRRLAPRARRVISVCSGAFVLGAAGLLDGKRATTHWAACGRMAQAFPRVTVQPDALHVRDGAVWTSAGVTAGMDLALALVEEDLGREVAVELARWFVMYLVRPGGQSQFSAHLAAQGAERAPIRDTVAWIADHPAADLSVETLARRAGMSPRNFARVFRAEVGATPARHVARVRLDAARRWLEESDAPAKVVAARCGFGSVESLRRALRDALRVTPGDYRARFRGSSATTRDAAA